MSLFAAMHLCVCVCSHTLVKAVNTAHQCGVFSVTLIISYWRMSLSRLLFVCLHTNITPFLLIASSLTLLFPCLFILRFIYIIMTTTLVYVLRVKLWTFMDAREATLSSEPHPQPYFFFTWTKWLY